MNAGSAHEPRSSGSFEVPLEAREPAPRVRTALALAIFWPLFGLAVVLPSVIAGWWRGEPEPLRMLAVFLGWQIWIPLSLLVLGLSRRSPLGWPPSFVAVAVHAGGVAVCLLVDLVTTTGLTWAVRALGGSPSPFSDVLASVLASGWAAIDLLIYAALVAVGLATEYYRRYRDRAVEAAQLEARLMEARLQVLKMQLNPHFLFNTLHSISALMHRDLDAADRMISVLSDLLRLSLETAGKQEIPLEQELNFLERYLEIETTRFSDRLTVHLDIEPRALDAMVPNLILQPLVENAIRHGIALRSAAGQVDVAARVVGAQLRLEVRDNGPGLAASPREGIGLSNTRARLAQLYGKNHQLEVRNAPLGGLIVRMAIPYVTAPESGGGEAQVVLAEPEAPAAFANPVAPRSVAAAGPR